MTDRPIRSQAAQIQMAAKLLEALAEEHGDCDTPAGEGFENCRKCNAIVEMSSATGRLLLKLAADALAAPQQDQLMIEQFVRDLYGAHDEILRLQGVAPADASGLDWPQWSGPANSIRWAERALGKRLAKTSHWSEFADPPARLPEEPQR